MQGWNWSLVQQLRAAWQGLKNMSSINQCTENRKYISVNGVTDFNLSALLTHSPIVLKGLTTLIISLLAGSSSNLREIVTSHNKATALYKKVKLRKAAPNAICVTLHHCVLQFSVVFQQSFKLVRIYSSDLQLLHHLSWNILEDFKDFFSFIE